MTTLPPVSVRKLSDFVTKGTTPTSIGRRFTARGVNFIKVETIAPDGRYLSGREAHIDSETHEILRRSQLAAGDILFSIAGALGRSTVVEDSWIPANTNQAFAIIRPSRQAGLNSRYLLWQLRSEAILRRVSEINVQAAQANLSLEQVRDFEIPLVSEEEQFHIAKTLDDAELLLWTLERLIAKKQAIKQGMMQQLLTGKIRLPGFTAEWTIQRFGDLALPVKARGQAASAVHSDAVVELEHIESGTGSVLPNESAVVSISLKTIFREGDVLFGKLRAYLRKYWLATSPGYCSTEIWALRSLPGKSVGGFVRYVVESEAFIEVASASHGTHMPRSDWGIVAAFEVPTPNVEEQIAIAQVLSSADAEIRSLRKQISQIRAIKQGMMQELLTGRTRLENLGVAI
ncbi:restriction endonuclease subunit S [Glaciibacter psychrotolerans]|uniref:Type I restriction enzyme S subunit n=1 Tax=Glaciibacter psychrotolerans TaxID=670054 RepID=A0A7Z0EAX1_9MICO|nr:restriction endonuclease subunit S [Leifsonia psychrotolerans]NYJ18288.1 type I restriction enzyme S subunit [Leifsonia psychrotolerans]